LGHSQKTGIAPHFSSFTVAVGGPFDIKVLSHYSF